MFKSLFGCLVFASALVIGLLPWASFHGQGAFAAAFDPLAILGTKHDFTGLNRRAGLQAMGGVAFSDFSDTTIGGEPYPGDPNLGNPCIYCHIPQTGKGLMSGDVVNDTTQVDVTLLGGIQGWNRQSSNLDGFIPYGETSNTFDSKIRSINPMSLLCLSCHDGTQALDQVVFVPPRWDPMADSSMHMRINVDGDLTSCSQCHNGSVAHDIGSRFIGQDLRDDHPISIMYMGLTLPDVDPDYIPPDLGLQGFANSIKLFDGFIECASCHDVHDPSRAMYLRELPEYICLTCHIK